MGIGDWGLGIGDWVNHIFDTVGLTCYGKCYTYRSKIVEICNRNLSLPFKGKINNAERNKSMVSEEIIQMNNNPTHIVMEIEVLTGSIDQHIKEMAIEYNKTLNKELLYKIRQAIQMNQVFALICHHAPFHPDRHGNEALVQNEEEILGSKKIEEMDNYEYLAYLYQVGLYYSKIDACSTEAFYPPITKDTLEELSKIERPIEFIQARVFFKDSVKQSILESMTDLFKVDSDKEINKDLVFCHFINTLAKDLGLGYEFGSDKVTSKNYFLEYSIGQLSEMLIDLRYLLYENKVVK